MARATRTSGSRLAGRRARGTTLIEVLIAMAILVLIMVGILQLFFVALQLNRGAASRTYLTYKAQQVAENIRMVHAIYKVYDITQVPANTGIPTPFDQTQVGTIFELPYSSSDPSWATQYAYWGPQGANVIEGSQGPVKLTYNITDGGTSWGLTVTAVPISRTDSPNALLGGGGIDAGLAVSNAKMSPKRVQYVTSLPK